MSISTMYEYVVLRLSPSIMRGETVNIGLAIFPEDGDPIIRISAPIGKIQAIDPTWNAERETRLHDQLVEALAEATSIDERISLLTSMGYTRSGEPGFFYATESGLDAEIREVSNLYVSTRSKSSKIRRSKLHKEIADRFKSMDLLGNHIDDLAKHRVVPHVPIPGNPDLKGDFVYKNGVYRITQTLDYRVSPLGARQKVSEACTKVMAASEATKVWGQDTKKFALVSVPKEIADIADSHLDLLYASGFEIFHADSKIDLARYHDAAFSH